MPPDWCHFCNLHTDSTHFDNLGRHRAGPRHGPYGRLLWMELAVERVLDWYTNQNKVRQLCLDDLVEVYHNGKRTRDNGN